MKLVIPKKNSHLNIDEIPEYVIGPRGKEFIVTFEKALGLVGMEKDHL